MDDESEIARDFDRVTRGALMGAGQIAESFQRRYREEQNRYEQQQAARAKESSEAASEMQRRDQRLATVLERDANRESFWQEATSTRIANTYAATEYLADRGYPEAMAAKDAMTDRLRDRYGINIDDLSRDHPTSPRDRHDALMAALDDSRQHGVDDSERLARERQAASGKDTPEAESPDIEVDSSRDSDDQEAGVDAGRDLDADQDVEAASTAAAEEPLDAESAETEHLADADRAGGEGEKDAANAELTRSQEADHASAETVGRASHQELTDHAPQPMQDAAVSYRSSAQEQLRGSGRSTAATGVQARPNRQLVSQRAGRGR